MKINVQNKLIIILIETETSLYFYIDNMLYIKGTAKCDIYYNGFM